MAAEAISQPPKIFISYSRQDEQVADKIVANLDSLGIPVWLDRREIQPGDSFLEKMNQGIGQASYVLVLFSNSSLQSKWVTREWASALANQSTTLIPILLEDGAIPPLLQDIVYIDFVSDHEKGLVNLANFFDQELSVITLVKGRRGSASIPLHKASRRELRVVAQKCMNETKIMDFLFDMEIDPGEIGGSSLNNRLTNLLHYVNRDGMLKDFAIWLSNERKKCVEYQLEQVRQGEFT